MSQENVDQNGILQGGEGRTGDQLESQEKAMDWFWIGIGLFIAVGIITWMIRKFF
jgi:hypothetical protein